MVDFALGISLLKELYSAAKKVNEARDLLSRQDLMEKIVDVQSLLIDAKDENITLRNRILELEEKLIVRDKLKFRNDHGCYYDDNGLAYCTKCFAEGKTVPLHREENDFLRCKACAQAYPLPEYLARQQVEAIKLTEEEDRYESDPLNYQGGRW